MSKRATNRKGTHKCSAMEKEDRLAVVEECLSKGWSVLHIWRAHGRNWNVEKDSLWVYAREVRARWRAEAVSDDRKANREELRAIIREGIKTAFEAQRAIPLADGGMELVSSPDVRSVMKGAELLARLDGLFQLEVVPEKPSMERVTVILAQQYGVPVERLKQYTKKVDAVIDVEGKENAGT